MRFDPLQQAVGGHELDERELAVPVLFPFLMTEACVEFFLADRVSEDVVVDPVEEIRELTRDPAMPPSQRRVEPQRAFRAEGGIPDLEREVPRVRAKEIQLLERGIPGCVGQVEGEREPIVRAGRTDEESHGAGSIREVTLG
jgi:hypothetical protein